MADGTYRNPENAMRGEQHLYIIGTVAIFVIVLAVIHLHTVGMQQTFDGRQTVSEHKELSGRRIR